MCYYTIIKFVVEHLEKGMNGFFYLKNKFLRAVGLLVFLFAASWAVWGVDDDGVKNAAELMSALQGSENFSITGDINIEDDLVIDFPGKISVSANVTLSCKNFVLYGGTLELAHDSKIITSGDFILLGSDFQNDSEKSYFQSRLSPCNFTALDLQRTYSGKVEAKSRVRLYAGKNFYANGIVLKGTGSAWYIELPDITNAKNGFAECYNCNVSNSKVKFFEENDSVNNGESKVRMPAYNCTGSGCSNWLFDDLQILTAYTVRDNVVRVEFNNPIRNLNGELNGENGLLSQIKYFDGTKDVAFSGIYSEPDCQNALASNSNISKSYSVNKETFYYFYLKADSTWNTDATGTFSGEQKSTDRSGNHKNAVPYLKLPSNALTDIWGKRIKDYSSSPYTAVEDKTGPVLYSVRTGQENHEQNTGNAESQHSYDAHNFLEFRYSEPVNFGSMTTSISDVYIPAYINGVENIVENIKVTNKFGVLSGTYTKQGALNFTGLGIIQNGLIHTASAGRSNQYVNALYRKDVYSLCISVAGYTDGTVTDSNGNIYKKWNACINSAIQPSGTVDFVDSLKTTDENNGLIRLQNRLVYDLNDNFQEKYDFGNPEIFVVNSKEDIYGPWDLNPPELVEAVGSTSGTGTVINRIEFSSRDDSLNDKTSSIKADGGLRFCTIYSSLNAFSVLSEGISIDSVFGGAPVFKTKQSSDSPYFGFTLKNSSLPLTAEVGIKYENGYITDLAGNLLPNCELTSKDKIPPAFNLTIAPVAGKELLVIFSKKLMDSALLKSELTSSFDFISIDSAGNPIEFSDLKIDSSKSAEFVDYGDTVSSHFTCIKLYLNRAVTLNDVKTLYVRYKNANGSLKDTKGNAMQLYSAHALSDFAVNTINPLYAYNSAMYSTGSDLSGNFDYSSAVHDWDNDQQNFGTLVLPSSEKNESAEIHIIAQVTDGTLENLTPPQNARVYLSANPSSGSVSEQINSDLNETKRIWLPELGTGSSSGSFDVISKISNSNFYSCDGVLLEKILESDEQKIKFTLDSSVYASWINSDQVTFLFALTDSGGNPLTIIHSPELDAEGENNYLPASKKFPLFALRLKDSSDITSFDLWSFKVKNMVGQRGGVSILNNVINPLKGDQTIVEIQNPSSGKVRVMIMTLDGNVVTYLSRGSLAEGLHKFTWDGKNLSGNSVARGIYFVRVIGNGFDETRKVMVVK